MTVSVALATYNGARFITEQLDSLRLQTHPIDEVVIIDDCSTDGTAEAVQKYIAEHGLNWQFSVAKSNSGYKRNFYNCLKKTTGDIVFLCDQDDVWYREKIEKIMSVFKNDPQCLAVNSSFDMTDSNGEIINPFDKANTKTANHNLILFPIGYGEAVTVDLKTVLVYNISPGCTCAFKREAVDRFLETSECRMPHDWELNIIAAEKGGLRFLNLPLIGYRQHGNNVIGLSEDESFGPLKMRGSTDVRFAVLELQTAQRDLIKAYLDRNDREQTSFFKALDRFCRNRQKILTDKKVLPCFKNVFIYPKLKQVATIHFRGILGDFIFAVKGKFSKGVSK